MISRLKPCFGLEELKAIFCNGNKDSIKDFEIGFSEKFKAKYSLAFPLGRTGIYCFLKALNIENAEVIMPAYTCVVVAHAIVLSGNIPRFIDIDISDFNMNLDLLNKSINKYTKAIVATHLFGYPMNMMKLKEIVDKHEKKYGHKIYIISDCAHSYGAKYNNKLVNNYGDVAVFALNISKMISSVFGGMLTTNDEQLYIKLKKYRKLICDDPTTIQQTIRVIYFLTTYPTFQNNIYSIINFIEDKTNFIDSFTKYYDEEKIEFPKNWKQMIGHKEAAIGIEQLKKYDDIIKNRIHNASSYNSYFTEHNVKNMKRPIIIDGATYSHYVPLVKKRKDIVQYMKTNGVQIGVLLEYSIPYMKAYRRYKVGEYRNSKYCANHIVNLPIYKNANVNKIAKLFERGMNYDC